MLLGKEYIRQHPDLSHIHDSTAKLLEYQQIREAIVLKLAHSEAHLEFVLCAPRMDALFSINFAYISHQVCTNNLLVKVRTYYIFYCSQFITSFLQVPSDDMKLYAQKVFNDLIQPLKAAGNGTFTGPNTIATVLLAETLLAFLPTMLTHNITCDILKEYQIIPLQSGLMQHNQRVRLAQFADARSGFLAVHRARIQRVFIPLGSFSAPRRGKIVELVTFLNTIQTINRREIAEKASEIIIKSCFEDLEPKVQNLSSFKYPEKLASSGFIVQSFCTRRVCQQTAHTKCLASINGCADPTTFFFESRLKKRPSSCICGRT